MSTETVLKLNGSDAYLELPPLDIDASAGLTVETWVRYDSFNSWSRLFDACSALGADNIILANWGVEPKLNLQVYIKSVWNYIAVANCLDKSWMHICATIDNTGFARLYKNGVLIGSGQTNRPDRVHRTQCFIGKSTWPSDGLLAGELCEFRIWQKALSADQILGQMHHRATGKEDGLFLCYHLIENAKDSGPNGLDATPKGSCSFAAFSGIGLSDALPSDTGVDADANMKAKPLQHLTTVQHQSTVILFGIDDNRHIWYAARQQESIAQSQPDSATAPSHWHPWQRVLFSSQPDDASVLANEQKEAEELYTTQSASVSDKDAFIAKNPPLHACYTSDDLSAAGPVQAVSAGKYLYVFRSSTRGTLLCDRYVFDGAELTLVPALEVRYQSSQQRYTPQPPSAGNSMSYDTLGYRNKIGDSFFEPTMELRLFADSSGNFDIVPGWFGVARVPTAEFESYRWHIFAVCGKERRLDAVTLRETADGWFTLDDYTFTTGSEFSVAKRQIPGLIYRSFTLQDAASLPLTPLVPLGAPAICRFDEQAEVMQDDGTTTLLRQGVRVMLVLPVGRVRSTPPTADMMSAVLGQGDRTTASLVFPVHDDGTLAFIDNGGSDAPLRNHNRELILSSDLVQQAKRQWSAPNQATVTEQPGPSGARQGIALDGASWLEFPHVGLGAEFTMELWTRGDRVTSRALGTRVTLLHRPSDANASVPQVWLGTVTAAGSMAGTTIDQLRLEVGGTGIQTQCVLPTSWSRLVVTCTRTAGSTALFQARLLVDGVQIGSADSLPQLPTADRGRWFVGGSSAVPANGQCFVGRIADLRLWNKSLSDAALADVVNKPQTGQELNLFGWWPCSEVMDNLAIDLTPSHNHAKLVGGAVLGGVRLARQDQLGRTLTGLRSETLVAAPKDATIVESVEVLFTPPPPGPVSGLALRPWGRNLDGSSLDIAPSNVSQSVVSLGQGRYQVRVEFMVTGFTHVRGLDLALPSGTGDVELSQHHMYVRIGSATRKNFADTLAIPALDDTQAASILTQEAKLLTIARMDKDRAQLVDEIALMQNSTEGQAAMNTALSDQTQAQSVLDNALKALNAAKQNPLNQVCYIMVGSSLATASKVVPQYGEQSPQLAAAVPSGPLGQLSALNGMWFFNSTGPLGTFTIDALKISASDPDIRLAIDFPHPSLAQAQPYVPTRYPILCRQGKPTGRGTEWCFGEGPNQQFLRAANETGNPYIFQLNWYTPLAYHPEGYRVWLVPAGAMYNPGNLTVQQLAYDTAWADKQVKDSRVAYLLSVQQSAASSLADKQAALAAFDANLASLRQALFNSLSAPGAKALTPLTTFTDRPNARGALLGFVRSAGGLRAIESFSAHIELSYIGWDGTVRTARYDTINGTWQYAGPRACLSFNGTSELAEIADLDPGTSFTIELWVNPAKELPDPLTPIWTLLSKQDDGDVNLFKLSYSSAGIGVTLAGEDYAEGTLKGHKWQHLAVTVAPDDDSHTRVTVYRNGDTLWSRRYPVSTYSMIGKNWRLGAAKKSGVDGDFFCGCVADLRIWGVALERQEIATQRFALLSGNEPSLLAFWPLSELSGPIVDASGGGRNAVQPAATRTPFTLMGAAPLSPVLEPQSTDACLQFDSGLTVPTSAFTIEWWIYPPATLPTTNWDLMTPSVAGSAAFRFMLYSNGTVACGHPSTMLSASGIMTPAEWQHFAFTFDHGVACLYRNGVLVVKKPTTMLPLTSSVLRVGSNGVNIGGSSLCELRVFNKASSGTEIQSRMHRRMYPKDDSAMIACLPLSIINSSNSVTELVANIPVTMTGSFKTPSRLAPVTNLSAPVINEYASTSEDPSGAKVSLLRQLIAYSDRTQLTIVDGKRLEELELRWLGNAQFAPTLIGYIEGAPPVPSENLTMKEDYDDATSVKLELSEDVEYKWLRTYDSNVGQDLEALYGLIFEGQVGASVGVTVTEGFSIGMGVQGAFTHDSVKTSDASVTAVLSQTFSDRLGLKGEREAEVKFSALNKERVVPKNVGYALVQSTLADVFILRMKRSKAMVAYQITPVDGQTPAVNTITFMINPTYTMNGTLDGQVGTESADDSYYRDVAKMRSLYGSRYPASYYRLQEAQELQQMIEREEQQREAFYANFQSRQILDAGWGDGGDLNLGKDKDTIKSQSTEQAKTLIDMASSDANTNTADDQSWQDDMALLLANASRRNIVNTYVWDGDGGLRAETQSFASAYEWSVGGAYSMSLGIGLRAEAKGTGWAELNFMNTWGFTRTLVKSENKRAGLSLDIEVNTENRGITDVQDRPMFPGQKVDRYRFLSFFLAPNKDYFTKFFSDVVDPVWLQSNSAEARALRQVDQRQPLPVWRVLHRVTYVERPGLGEDGSSGIYGPYTPEFAYPGEDNLPTTLQKLNGKIESLEAKLDLILQKLGTPTS